jgi:hypothetical protein
VCCGLLFSFWSTSGDHLQKGSSIGGDKLLENSQNSIKPDLTLGTCQNLANSFLGFDQIWLLKLFWVQFRTSSPEEKKKRLVCCGHSILDNGKSLT